VAEQPTGTVTLLFGDIEGSTRLLDRLGNARYAGALELHRRMSAVRAALGQEGFDREVGRGRALSLDETVELSYELARLAKPGEV
jgi:class 3 adenylate cyclase